jgi:predicted nucleic acid-binding protein
MSAELLQVALDTNVLVYAEGLAFLPGDLDKPDRVRNLLSALDPDEVVLPVQVLGELHRVLVGKAKRPPLEARAAILTWRDLYATVDTNLSVMVAAMDLAVDHQLSVGDAVILAAAAEAGCRLVLSEDLHEGFTWRGLTVVNPVASDLHPLLSALMSTGSPPTA